MKDSSGAPFHIISIIFGAFSCAMFECISLTTTFRWKPFDPARNWPDIGPRFAEGERVARQALRQLTSRKQSPNKSSDSQDSEDRVQDDRRDLDWATVLKRVFESYIRGERPNMYGEALRW